VVNKLRWAFDAKKAGHAGTLDPDATGLLPVALGEATKTIAYLGDALKGYEFTVRWGRRRRPTTRRARSSRPLNAPDRGPDHRPRCRSSLAISGRSRRSSRP
jgi:hypothetical protein